MGKSDKKYGLGKRGGEGFETALPSGETCFQRAISIEDMLEMGIMDKIDSLSGIVQTEHIERVTGKGKQTPAQQAASTMAALDPTTEDGRTALFALLKDKSRWENLLEFVNKVVVRSVIEPPVYDGQEGAAGQPAHGLSNSVDVHDVDLQDKLVIMNAAMSKLQAGVVAAEPFREGRQDDVAHIPDGEGVRDEAVNAPGGDGEAGS